MKRLGVALGVVGLVLVVVAFNPRLAGVKSPAPFFGPMQQQALIAGLVVLVLGLIVFYIGQRKEAKAGESAPAAEPPPAPEPEPEPPAEEPEPPAEEPPKTE